MIVNVWREISKAVDFFISQQLWGGFIEPTITYSIWICLALMLLNLVLPTAVGDRLEKIDNKIYDRYHKVRNE